MRVSVCFALALCACSPKEGDDSDAAATTPHDLSAVSVDSSVDAATPLDATMVDAGDLGTQALAPGVYPVSLPAACATATTTCPTNGTDAAACLQTLISAGKSVTLPKNATFTIASGLNVPANVSITGCNATIKLTQPGVVLAIKGAGVTIDGLHLDYAAATAYAGTIDLAVGVSNLRVENSTFSGVNVAALQINNIDISDVTFVNNTITAGHFGILFNTTNWPAADLPILAHHPHHVTIDHNTIFGVTADPIEVNSAVFAYQPHNSGKEGVAANDIQITNNALVASLSQGSGGGFCVGIAGAFNVNVVGNLLSQCKWQGVHIEDAANLILLQNNVMKGTIGPKPTDTSSWAAADCSGVILLHVDHISILDNQIDSSIGSGIELSYDGTYYDHDVTISGNTIDGAGTSCFYAGGTSMQDLATLIGPSMYLGTEYGGNTALHCGAAIVSRSASAKDVTVTGNVNF